MQSDVARDDKLRVKFSFFTACASPARSDFMAPSELYACKASSSIRVTRLLDCGVPSLANSSSPLANSQQGSCKSPVVPHSCIAKTNGFSAASHKVGSQLDPTMQSDVARDDKLRVKFSFFTACASPARSDFMAPSDHLLCSNTAHSATTLLKHSSSTTFAACIGGARALNQHSSCTIVMIGVQVSIEASTVLVFKHAASYACMSWLKVDSKVDNERPMLHQHWPNTSVIPSAVICSAEVADKAS